MLERATNWMIEAVSFACDDVLDAPTPCEAWVSSIVHLRRDG